MKVFLMHRGRDFRLVENLPTNVAELTADLELEILFDAMAAGDSFLREVAENAVLASLNDPEAILYRQHVLADCLAQPVLIREMYGIAVEALESERKVWSLMWERDASSALHRSIEVLRLCLNPLRNLWRIAKNDGPRFRSEGFTRFFAMIAAELNENYLRSIEDHLQRLEFGDGVLMSAALGIDCKGDGYVLRKTEATQHTWFERVHDWVVGLTDHTNSGFVYEVDDRDETGCRILGDLRAQGIVHVARALAQSTDHVLSFFKMLRLELGFYIGGLNLHERLSQKEMPICFPEPLPHLSSEFRCQGLYDVCLSLRLNKRSVGNDVKSDGKHLVIITGANRGGKSTFLRSVGLAHLMMQCGIFVPAELFSASACNGIFTHFKREEDASMKSGKLDEELSRMNAIVEVMTPGSLVLLNESFASTNEREGAEIAAQIVRALLKVDIKIFYVTHLFALADGFYRAGLQSVLFLRAERLADGQRTFRMLEGEPQPTSFGEDLYRTIFEPAGFD
ncbi:MAG: DNA mismatch repair protein MutS [Terriglobia bacterium]|nr:DNA mismatch repair protein MutS [Terriglobia bacterium]